MTFSRRRREDLRGRYAPTLAPVWLMAAAALAAVAVLAVGFYYLAHHLIAAGQAPGTPVQAGDVIKATVTILTLIGAVLAGLYAYRKQLLAEGDAHRADAAQLANRYAAAAEQLGHDRAAVRLAGVYALARLADDWAEQRQVCIDVLCAYLRMPYRTDPDHPGYREGEREVRHTVIRVIRAHLQDPGATTTWCGVGLYFTGAHFDGGDFSGSHFVGGTVDFTGATFGGGTVDFTGATFGGDRAGFLSARFDDGVVNFAGARFLAGTVDFDWATFDGGRIAFSGAHFDGGRVTFDHATFSDGSVSFADATLAGDPPRFAHAEFRRTRFRWGPILPPSAGQA
ncbi:pentapeptide repeat-containing protein [Kitasatospora sp. NPDC058965]|uniref:pentapeptide repeat-containing protein n=1 Tax=Kitasatospora sp. NPDC058965 TaxID=3346682 RepID=UPI0036929966